MSKKDDRFFGVVIDAKVLLILVVMFVLGYLFISNNEQNGLQNTQSDGAIKLSNTKSENKNNQTSKNNTSSTQDSTNNSAGYGFDTGTQDINIDNIQVAGADNTLRPVYEGDSNTGQHTGLTAPDETMYFEGGIVDDGTTGAIVNPDTNLIPSNEQVNCISGTEGCYEVLPDPIEPIAQ